MREIEKKIIKLIQINDLFSIKELLKKVADEPFGSSTPEFINHPDLFAYISKYFLSDKHYFIFLLCIEEYFLAKKVNLLLSQEKLIKVEDALKECLWISPASKARGTALLPIEIANAKFIKKLYLTNDDSLIALFKKYLPLPRAKIFAGHSIPEFIEKREQASGELVRSVLDRNKNDVSLVESAVTKLQRIIRAANRKKENINRISYVYEVTNEEAKKLLEDASTPYTPQCDSQLSKRIVEAAKKADLFSTVTHLAAVDTLESIFDEGLCGRQTLLQSYMLFRPSALFPSDIMMGDANVVCLGAYAIDPRARHGLELQFDARKIAKNNPCVFYKQRDLGFALDKTRIVYIDDFKLSFSHTALTKDYFRCPDYSPNTSFFTLYYFDENHIQRFAKIKNELLISYNLEKMHQILTLNFFRFIDQLEDEEGVEDKIAKQKIYSALSKLSDKKLEDTLLDIGKNMIDTMEFNFYGVYQINFSALLSIKIDDPHYLLNIEDFVNELKAGNIKKLNEVKEKIPELFKSYRFIDYLLSEIKDKIIISELSELREICCPPAWIGPKK